MSLSVASKWSAGGDTFVKGGLGFEDHHFKTPDGKYQKSPPSKFKAMYDYLPSEGQAQSPQRVPPKIVMTCDNPETGTTALKNQTRCLGVYVKVPGRDHNGHPIWKHVDEDLCFASSTVDGEQGWVIAQFQTFGVKEHRSMTIKGSELPITSKASMWMAWNGRDWAEAPTVKCRGTYHGWGRDGQGQVSNTESSVSPHRSPKKERSPKN